MDANRIQDAATVAEIQDLVERLARKIQTIIDPAIRDGLEDATDVLLEAMPRV